MWCIEKETKWGLMKECVMYRWGVVYLMVVFVQRRDRRNYKWQKVKTMRGLKGGVFTRIE